MHFISVSLFIIKTSKSTLVIVCQIYFLKIAWKTMLLRMLQFEVFIFLHQSSLSSILACV